MMPKTDTLPKNAFEARVEEIRKQGLFFPHPEPFVPPPEPPAGGIDGMNSCLVGILLGLNLR